MKVDRIVFGILKLSDILRRPQFVVQLIEKSTGDRLVTIADNPLPSIILTPLPK
jgi:hypothetical protein